MTEEMGGGGGREKRRKRKEKGGRGDLEVMTKLSAIYDMFSVTTHSGQLLHIVIRGTQRCKTNFLKQKINAFKVSHYQSGGCPLFRSSLCNVNRGAVETEIFNTILYSLVPRPSSCAFIVQEGLGTRLHSIVLTVVL